MNRSPDMASEEQHSRFELRTLLETSRLLIESQDPDFVLNNLLLITMGKLMIPRAMIIIRTPSGPGYFVSKSKGRGWLSEDETVDLQISDELKHQTVIYSKDHPEICEKLSIEEGCTLFNLQTSNHHLGFLCLGPKGTREDLVDHELEFIESLTIISSVAIANSRMFQELRFINRKLDRKVHDLNTLLELSKDFNLMVDRDEIARTFKFAMLGQMLIRTFFFALDVNGEKTMVAGSGLNRDPETEDLQYLFDSDDIRHCAEDSDHPFLKDNDIHLVIGLRFQNEKIGVVGVGPRANKEGYGEAEVNFLQSLGNLALLTIQKTLLLEERIEKHRMEEELSLAKTIQEGLLPSPLPEIRDFDIAAINVSSRQVGGDYFDLLRTPDDGHLMAIADVTGKGVPASLLMANLQSMLHALAPLEVSLSEATGRINDIIHDNTPSDKFITYFWGKISSDRQSLHYVNAGHNPPMLFREGSDEPELLEAGGVILGAMPTLMPYESEKIALKKGDLLVLFTDGVTEAMSPDQTEEYEEGRLIECINRNRDRSSEEIMQAVIDDINRFSDNIQYDDITMIVLRVC